MSAGDLLEGMHRRHHGQSPCVKLAAVDHVLAGRGTINPQFHEATLNACRCNEHANEMGGRN